MPHCPVDYPYPGVDKAVQAITFIASNWSTALQDKECLAHCAYVVLGAGLSVGLPLDPVFGDTPIESEAEAKAIIEEAVNTPQVVGAAEGDVVGKVDWKKVLQAVKFLLNLFA